MRQNRTVKVFGPLFWRDIAHLFQRSWKSFLWSGLLLGFFLFLFHVFAGVSLQASVFTDTVKEKLGIFFYVKDYDESATVYGRLIALQNELDTYDISHNFRSKDDALTLLFGDDETGLLDKFEEFGIGNPLPSTLYVVFDSEQQLRLVKRVMYKYRDIIRNIGDLDDISSLRKQETRNVTAIRVAQLVFAFSLIVLAILAIGLFTIFLYFLQVLFYGFKDSIEIKKVLGASYGNIVLPFVFYSVLLLLFALFVASLMTGVAFHFFTMYVSEIFSIDLWTLYIEPYLQGMFGLLYYEIVALLLIGVIFSFLYIRHLVLRVRYE